jgi:hypothetical protein
LPGDAGERGAGFFGFDHADRDAVNEEQVVAGAAFERDFAQGDAAGCAEVSCL